MTKFIQVHNTHPQLRRLGVLKAPGTVFAYPSDTGYALACQINDLKTIERIRRIRKLNDNHRFTLICSNLKIVSEYAIMSTPIYKAIKLITPAPTTFILKTLPATPKRLYHKKRRELGIRIPSSAVVRAVLDVLGGVMISASAIAHDQVVDWPISAEKISELYPNMIDFIIETEPILSQPSTLIDCTTAEVKVVRVGLGDAP